MGERTGDEEPRRGWDTSRPWRTSRLPELVSIAGAAVILDVSPATVSRWLKPGSGARTAWNGFGRDQTLMITPLRIWSPSDGPGEPVWVRADVERYARDIAPLSRPGRKGVAGQV